MTRALTLLIEQLKGCSDCKKRLMLQSLKLLSNFIHFSFNFKKLTVQILTPEKKAG